MACILEGNDSVKTFELRSFVGVSICLGRIDVVKEDLVISNDVAAMAHVRIYQNELSSKQSL